MAADSLVRDPTFYHYKLIRKISLRPERKYSYMAAAVLVAAALTAVYGWIGLLYSGLALIITILTHAFVVKITVRRVDALAEKKWAFRLDWPWIGPLPVMDTQLSVFRRMHFHLFLIGCCVTGLFYPWAHSSLVIALLYWHLWLLNPRFRLLWSLRRERGDGIIRLEYHEVSYYHQ
ncbi:hypothetical protein SD71_16345 [Cohnella kolymensis]|uniref:Transposase n=1 Tax=Cohnella kolymensis TaxID=1590652 RepID=A0ABR5A1J1_9BACL|nr:hypothetical protein [Cohnella kolymensis]KIL34931.1 hypothetical protein SD71_16345 [Cohnella kolymensis]